MKKSWGKPELIIFVKRNSNDVILGLCKSSQALPENANGGCEAVTYALNQTTGKWDTICIGSDKCR